MRGVILVFCILAPVKLFAATSEGKATTAQRDATRLVECMKALDPVCSAALTYTKFAEDMGMPREQMVKAVTELDMKLKSIDAKYIRFELSGEVNTFSGDGRDYAFVPYVSVMEAGSKRSGVRSFFIGVSLDGGTSWQFVDGVDATPERIKVIIPSYAGQSLPVVGPLELSN